MSLAIKKNTLTLLDANWTNKTEAIRFLKYALPIIAIFYFLALFSMTVGQNAPNTNRYNGIIEGITNPDRFNFFGSLGFSILCIYGMLKSFRADIKQLLFVACIILSYSAASLIMSIGTISAQITLLFIFAEIPFWKTILGAILVITAMLPLIFINFILWTAVELSFPKGNNNKLSTILKQLGRPYLFVISLLSFALNAHLLIAYTG